MPEPISQMSNDTSICKGRFAPSPTGRMHLGNIFTALVSWLSVKSRNGIWVLRHEDLDRQRSRREYAILIEEDLRWLGLDWDEGGLDNRIPSGSGTTTSAPYSQSQRDAYYREMLSALCATGMVYPCYCRRSDIMATNAPHQSDGRVVYAGTCKPTQLPDPSLTLERLEEMAASRQWRSLRLAVPDRQIPFDDMVCGHNSFNLAYECGDFIVKRGDGAWAYQLAVVADDHLMGISEVIRGNDLLLSTSQQLYLYGLMGWESPRFGHLPLLVNNAGQRLSKRDSSLNMEPLRERFTPERLIGLLAGITGLAPDTNPVSAVDLLKNFSPSKLQGINTITIDEKYFS